MVSEQEFHIMVDELLYREEVSFTMLCSIAEGVLRPSVRRWCAADDTLRGKNYEEDIMQEIHLRLIKTTVSHFLLREEDGSVNMDPAGFEAWMFRVARNIKKDFANRVRRISLKTTDLVEIGQEPAEDNPDRLEDLARAFRIVLDADVQVYKVLTWVAQSLFIVELDVTRIRSNELIIDTFGEKTLFEMRDMLVTAARGIRWMEIRPEQLDKIDRALRAPYDEERCYGQVTYREFFMKKGGKATISDWVNRMNGMIKRVMEHEACNC
ncbi:MAG: hypothetical protein E7436_01085 [Ruminococcaceae bacterium]|nr:hypothetical protein [Oscillospiraceae bacterium]